ncbi:hypothetical protein LCGC14_1338980, partial [marine sediment metagenome]
VNVHELLNRFLEVADVQTAEMLNLPRPKLKGGKPTIVVAPASDELKAFIQDLGARAEAIKGRGVDPKKDNMLKLSSDGRKAALDMRLVNPASPDFAESKINILVKNVAEKFKATKKDKGTQLVFADLGTPKPLGKGGLFSVYRDIKAKLIKLGIPQDQIAFIHDAKTKAAAKKLVDKVNAGKIRVLIGSTGKMGTGMNAQRRLAALHHIDAPWRPDEVEQRDGRILRQGNMFDEVEIVRYVTEGSFDTNIWQTLTNKAAFIQQLAPGRLKGRSIEDVDDVVMSFEQIKAIATGDPRIIEKFKTDTDVKRLQDLESEHRNARYRAESDIGKLPGQIEVLKNVAGKLTKDVKAFDFEGKKFTATIGKKTFDNREDLGAEIIKISKSMREKRRFTTDEVGTFRGKPLSISVTDFGTEETFIKGEMRHAGRISDKALGTIASLESSIKPASITKRLESVNKEVAVLEKRLKDLNAVVDAPFPEAAELKKLLKKQEQLNKDLGIGESDVGVVEGEVEDTSVVDPANEPSDVAADYGGTPPKNRRGAGPAAAEGPFLAEFPTGMGGSSLVKPLEMPEIVQLARALLGEFPTLSKRLRKSRGLFFSGGGRKARIVLNPEIFQKPDEAAAVLAHEIGHLIDYLPHETLARGNLVGRLNSLLGFMRQEFGESIVNNKQLRKELIAVSEFWRPYDKEAAPDDYKAYRNSARELYADAVSVLLNAPGTLERMAPAFFEGFFDQLDKKPDVKKEYFKLQDLLSGRGPEIAQAREQDIRRMFQKGEAISKEQNAERQLRDSRFWERVRQGLDDVNWPVDKKIREAEAKGIVIPDETNPRFTIQEASMFENDVYLLLDEIDTDIKKVLEASGLTEEDADVLLFFDRVMGDRSGLANPLGHNPKSAESGLKNLEKTLGADKFKVLRQTMQQLHDINFRMTEEAVKTGVYNAELFEEKIKPNKNFYAAFQVLDYVDDFVSAGVKQQIGTLKEIRGTFITTVLKMVSLKQLIAKNLGQGSFRDTWLDIYPDEILKLKPVNPQDKIRVFRAEKGQGFFTMLEDGKQVAYQVDPYIARSIELSGPDKTNMVVQIIKLINNSVFYPLFITYNPGFQAFNAVRDFKRTFRNLPEGITMGEFFKEWLGAWPTARLRANNISDDLMKEMIGNKALTAPMNDFVLGNDEDSYERLLIRHNLLPSEPVKHRQKILNALMMFLEPIRQLGSTIEAMPKIAGYNLRKQAGEKGKSLAYNTRTFTGTPNWLVKGLWTNTTNVIFWFSNIFKEGFKTDAQIAFDPKTRGGWWWKAAQVELLPKFLMLLGSIGAGGPVLKDFYDRVTEYDKTNYIIVPLGYQTGGRHGWKAVYLRFPHDETGRVMSGLFWKIANAIKDKEPAQMQQILDFGAGQLPSVAPPISMTDAWKDFLTGKNPYDNFRGREIISKTEFAAGGWPKLKKMLMWTANQFGVTRFATFDDSEKTWFEAAVQTVPVVNRLIRVTDWGLEEKARPAIEELEAERARFRLARGSEASALLHERFRLSRLKQSDQLSDKGLRRLNRMNAFF